MQWQNNSDLFENCEAVQSAILVTARLLVHFSMIRIVERSVEYICNSSSEKRRVKKQKTAKQLTNLVYLFKNIYYRIMHANTDGRTLQLTFINIHNTIKTYNNHLVSYKNRNFTTMVNGRKYGQRHTSNNNNG